MGLRLRAALLMCLAAAAAWSAAAAWESLKPKENYELPQELTAQYAQSEGAKYYLKASGGYVAVYSGLNDLSPRITDIEVSALRRADRALLELGIPVKNREELLSLLEDLGS